jgi:hypothetical protein
VGGDSRIPCRHGGTAARGAGAGRGRFARARRGRDGTPTCSFQRRLLPPSAQPVPTAGGGGLSRSAKPPSGARAVLTDRPPSRGTLSVRRGEREEGCSGHSPFPAPLPRGDPGCLRGRGPITTVLPSCLPSFRQIEPRRQGTDFKWVNLYQYIDNPARSIARRRPAGAARRQVCMTGVGGRRRRRAGAGPRVGEVGSSQP